MDKEYIKVKKGLGIDVLSKALESLKEQNVLEIESSKAIERKAQYAITLLALAISLFPVTGKSLFNAQLLCDKESLFVIYAVVLAILSVAIFWLYVSIIKGRLETINSGLPFVANLNEGVEEFYLFMINTYVEIIEINNEINSKRNKQLITLFVLLFLFIILLCVISVFCGISTNELMNYKYINI